jgi:hypothetical protein
MRHAFSVRIVIGLFPTFHVGLISAHALSVGKEDLTFFFSSFVVKNVFNHERRKEEKEDRKSLYSGVSNGSTMQGSSGGSG